MVECDTINADIKVEGAIAVEHANALAVHFPASGPDGRRCSTPGDAKDGSIDCHGQNIAVDLYSEFIW